MNYDVFEFPQQAQFPGNNCLIYVRQFITLQQMLAAYQQQSMIKNCSRFPLALLPLLTRNLSPITILNKPRTLARFCTTSRLLGCSPRYQMSSAKPTPDINRALDQIYSQCGWGDQFRQEVEAIIANLSALQNYEHSLQVQEYYTEKLRENEGEVNEKYLVSLYSLALMYQQINLNSKTEELLLRVHGIFQKNPQFDIALRQSRSVELALGNLYSKMGQLEEMKAWYEEVRSNDSDFENNQYIEDANRFVYYFNYASGCLRLKLSQEGLALYRKAEEMFVNGKANQVPVQFRFSCLFGLGSLEYRKGNREKGLRNMEEAKAMLDLSFPQHILMYFNTYKAYEKLELYEEALKVLKHVEETFRSSGQNVLTNQLFVMGFTEQVRLLMESQEYEEEEQVIDRFLEEHRREMDSPINNLMILISYLMRARAKHHLGKHSEGVHSIKEAYKIAKTQIQMPVLFASQAFKTLFNQVHDLYTGRSEQSQKVLHKIKVLVERKMLDANIPPVDL